jgi:hypothetical protein
LIGLQNVSKGRCLVDVQNVPNGRCLIGVQNVSQKLNCIFSSDCRGYQSNKPHFAPITLPLSTPEDKLYSKLNAAVKLKVLVRVTYSGEFLVLWDFVISFMMKTFMELRCSLVR